MMPTQIMRECEAEGITFELVVHQIRVVGGKKLSPRLLEQVKERKVDIIELLYRDGMARDVGFLCIHTDEVYERQIGPNSHVFLAHGGDRWNAWRESWRPGCLKHSSVKQIAEKDSFEVALVKAKHYVDYILGKRSIPHDSI